MPPIFTAEPNTATTAPWDEDDMGSPRHHTRFRLLVTIAVAGLVVAGAVLAIHRSPTPDAQAAPSSGISAPDSSTAASASAAPGLPVTVAADTYLVAAPTPVPEAICVDTSPSMVTDGLATKSFTYLKDALATGVSHPDTVPTLTAVPPSVGQQVWVRVITTNSYATVGNDAYTRHIAIPGTRGLNAPAPLMGTDDFASRYATYQQAAADVKGDWTAQVEARSAAAAQIRSLAGTTSDGSDITGCLLGLDEVAGSGGPVRIMVVSDLEDATLQTLSGAPRAFTGNLSNVEELTIIQACPSGDPGTCQATLKTFLDRLIGLGLRQSVVTVQRPEDAATAIDTFIGNGHA